MGFDLVERAHHRVGPFIGLARARGPTMLEDNFEQDIVLSFGVAYRYW
jgi:hypothetical protein